MTIWYLRDTANRHLDRSEAQWRDMTVSACGDELSATPAPTKVPGGNRPHTPGRSYFSAPLEMTIGGSVANHVTVIPNRREESDWTRPLIACLRVPWKRT